MNIRNAKLTDSDDILYWRNDITTRVMSINNNIINQKEHDIWFNSALVDANCFIYIGVKNDVKLGIVKFDCDFNIMETEVSINVNPKARGQGVSFDLLSLSIKKISYLNFNLFKATIKKSNNLSKKIFVKCGFKFDYSDKELEFYTLNNK